MPDNVKQYINNLYSNISGSVIGPTWRSERFVFKRGVFQGDPPSPTIFICVFNPLLEYILSESKHGYRLDSDTSVISTPFADDFNIIKLSDQVIDSIHNSPEKFLGSQISFSGKQSEVFSYIHDGISKVLDNIDQSVIRDEYKVKVYSKYVIPAIHFKLTVHELTQTNLHITGCTK